MPAWDMNLIRPSLIVKFYFTEVTAATSRRESLGRRARTRGSRATRHHRSAPLRLAAAPSPFRSAPLCSLDRTSDTVWRWGPSECRVPMSSVCLSTRGGPSACREVVFGAWRRWCAGVYLGDDGKSLRDVAEHENNTSLT